MNNTFIDLPSPNCGPRNLVDGKPSVRQLIVHYTGMRSRNEALDRLCDESSKVSAHYLIDEAGLIYKMVAEDMRAWHAGVSFWNGYRDINNSSIGIELVNPGHEFGYRAFPNAQLAALTKLAVEIIERHQISQDDVLGHSDIAPSRKSDPGELFPWKTMSEHGIGRWPKDTKSQDLSPDINVILKKLAEIGYAVPLSKELGSDILDPETGTADVITAFQRRYRPAQVDGVLDIETATLIAAVAGSLHSA